MFIKKRKLHQYYIVKDRTFDLDRGTSTIVSLPVWVWDWFDSIATTNRLTRSILILGMERSYSKYPNLKIEEIIASEVRRNIKKMQESYWGSANGNKLKLANGLTHEEFLFGSKERSASQYLSQLQQRRCIARTLGKFLNPDVAGKVFPDRNTNWQLCVAWREHHGYGSDTQASS